MTCKSPPTQPPLSPVRLATPVGFDCLVSPSDVFSQTLLTMVERKMLAKAVTPTSQWIEWARPVSGRRFKIAAEHICISHPPTHHTTHLSSILSYHISYDVSVGWNELWLSFSTWEIFGSKVEPQIDWFNFEFLSYTATQHHRTLQEHWAVLTTIYPHHHHCHCHQWVVQ